MLSRHSLQPLEPPPYTSPPRSPSISTEALSGTILRL
ncbi:hypothetical protein Ahy_A01g002056 isoform B [Arachis hypogaea]|uniref:Uncharacterized protein n=1 Tax=Arachis hypogaea TaxID=3818 RepID=A0A445EQ05_ARAHY|nr:hypothetical protein Ahy_A01g002056 isoform B [Arachis hypogaea]